MKPQYSRATLKSLGYNEQEIRLILARNCTEKEKPILTTDSYLMQSQRYDGLTPSDRSIAEAANREWAKIYQKYRKK